MTPGLDRVQAAGTEACHLFLFLATSMEGWRLGIGHEKMGWGAEQIPQIGKGEMAGPGCGACPREGASKALERMAQHVACPPHAASLGQQSRQPLASDLSSVLRENTTQGLQKRALWLPKGAGSPMSPLVGEGQRGKMAPVEGSGGSMDGREGESPERQNSPVPFIVSPSSFSQSLVLCCCRLSLRKA